MTFYEISLILNVILAFSIVLNKLKQVQQDKEAMRIRCNKEYIEALLALKDDNHINAMQAFSKVINLIDIAFPFFKTAYIDTLVLGNTRYTDLVSEENINNIDSHFFRVEKMLDHVGDIDMEVLADETVVLLRWFREKRVKLLYAFSRNRSVV